MKWQWLLWNIATVGSTILGPIYGNEAAGNLLLFIAGLHGMLAVAMLSATVRESVRETPRSVPQWLSVAVSVATIGVLAACGWFWCAAAFTLAVAQVEGARRSEARP